MEQVFRNGKEQVKYGMEQVFRNGMEQVFRNGMEQVFVIVNPLLGLYKAGNRNVIRICAVGGEAAVGEISTKSGGIKEPAGGRVTARTLVTATESEVHIHTGRTRAQLGKKNCWHLQLQIQMMFA